MKNDNKDKHNDTGDCASPEDKSISEKVHQHLRDKNDHITDEDIRRAKINPDENELEVKPGAGTTQTDEKNGEPKVIPPWDTVDKNSIE
jgi:hypothetical protein